MQAKNQMQANPEKFQAFSVGPKTSATVKSFKLLGTELDYMLNFDTQVSNICQKAAGYL